jgi:hypothetical protein
MGNKFLLTQPAKATPFDNSTNGFTSTEVQSAIEEVFTIAGNATRAFTFSSYGGNANTGRYLEFFSNIASNEAPIEVINALNVITIVCRTSAANATCTIGFYNIQPTTPVLLYTVTFSAVKSVLNNGSIAIPLFTLPATGQLAIKIDSGSISKPHIYFTGQGG